MIWEGMPCLENTWRTNRYDKSTDMIVLWAEIKITYLLTNIDIYLYILTNERL